MSERQQSNFRRGTYTDAHISLMAYLNHDGIMYQSEVEFSRDETNQNGFELSYVADIFINDRRYSHGIIEVEGEGSNSSDNQKRDQFFAKLGLWVCHISNADAKKHPEMVLKFLEGKRIK